MVPHSTPKVMPAQDDAGSNSEQGPCVSFYQALIAYVCGACVEQSDSQMTLTSCFLLAMWHDTASMIWEAQGEISANSVRPCAIAVMSWPSAQKQVDAHCHE